MSHECSDRRQRGHIRSMALIKSSIAAKNATAMTIATTSMAT
jgi:hypothetical protein